MNFKHIWNFEVVKNNDDMNFVTVNLKKLSNKIILIELNNTCIMSNCVP